MVCQLDSLRKCIKLDALRKALNTLPKTLDDTYERILSKIDEEYEEDVLKIFQWLCFSARPMRVDEMVEVLAIVDSTSGLRFRPEQRLRDPHDILKICSTLVSITTTANQSTSNHTVGFQESLSLAHFSVKEYLISDRLKKGSMHRYQITPSSANVTMAKSCLIYLHYFENPNILTKATFNQKFPFARYAAEFWPLHSRNITDDVDREEVDFLGYNLVEAKNSCFINLLSVFNPEKRMFKKEQFLSPLYYMSYLGMSGVVELLLNQGTDVNAKSGNLGSALSAASKKGHENVVRLLLEKGADVNADSSALWKASRWGHEKVVQLLLDKGADVNAQNDRAMRVASKNGQEQVVRLLLEKGANINTE